LDEQPGRLAQVAEAQFTCSWKASMMLMGRS
jgi:hypothetical protein